MFIFVKNEQSAEISFFQLAAVLKERPGRLRKQGQKTQQYTGGQLSIPRW